jgi:hypothetical protein
MIHARKNKCLAVVLQWGKICNPHPAAVLRVKWGMMSSYDDKTGFYEHLPKYKCYPYSRRVAATELKLALSSAAPREFCTLTQIVNGSHFMT